MNCLDDHNYYDNGGYPPLGGYSQDEGLSRDRAKTRGFTAKTELIGENTSRQPGGEQRPTKFPAKSELDMILRKVRSVLNKISALNYSKLQKRWVNLIPTEPSQIAEILQLLVSKGLQDPMYMQIYAQLASDILSANPSISNSLRNTLSKHLHHELQSCATDMELAKYGRSDETADTGRRRRVTLYRFIAELFVENVCSTAFVTERVTDLIGPGRKWKIPPDAEEPLECICIFLMFAGHKLEECKGSWLNDIFFKLNLTETSRLPIISKRMQFMLMDLIEMRSNGWVSHTKWWVPRAPTNGTTIDFELDNLKAIVSNSRRNRKTGVRLSRTSRRTGERTLTTILNQVVPANLERKTLEFGQIFQKNRSVADLSAKDIVYHILRSPDPMFIRIQSTLLSKVCLDNSLLKTKLITQLFKCIKENPDSVSAIRFCTELYILGMISLGQIISTFLKNPAIGIECSCVFFHRAQLKLYRDWRKIKHSEKVKINYILDCMAKNAQGVNGHRLKCMVLDIHDLRLKNWEATRCLLWNPPILSSCPLPFTVENAVNIFEMNEEDGIEFLQENVGTNRIELEKFVETMCIWAIWGADVVYLGSCGKYIKSILEMRLLTAKRLESVLGRLVHTVTLMKNKPDGWTHFGIIMQEIYNH